MSTNKFSPRAIIKSTSVLSLGTLSSRILGFLRDIILAKLLGTGIKADAFFVAFKIPNLFRDFVGEGATNAAVVPVFSEYYAKKDKEDFWNFVSVVLSLAFIVLSVITLLGIVFAPLIVRMIAPGFMADPEKLLLTIQLTKWMFPYLIFIGLTAYSMGILYTFRSFAVPAFSPCLLNIAIIISAFISSRTMVEPVFGLAVGVLVGGLLQLMIQLVPLKKLGMRYRKPKTLRHPGAKKIGRLLLPRMFGSGVYQLTVLIDTFCASLSFVVGQGGISAIYYANRLIQFPMGVFGVALANVVLPTLSDFAHKKDMDSMKKTIVFSLENIFFVMCPFIVIFALLSTPIIRVLFQRGEFNAYSTDITSWALTFYGLGLFSFGGIKILVTAFHALQDTKTPVKVAIFCLVVNAVLNFVLMGPLKIGGIALASAIAGTVDFLILFYFLEKKLGKFNGQLKMYFLKVILAAALTGVGMFTFWRYCFISNEIIKLCFAIISGFLFYGYVCYVFKVMQAQKVWKWLRDCPKTAWTTPKK